MKKRNSFNDDNDDNKFGFKEKFIIKYKIQNFFYTLYLAEFKLHVHVSLLINLRLFLFD